MTILRKILFVCLAAFVLAGCSSAETTPAGETVRINDDLEIARLTDHCFRYTAWAQIGSWGRVGCNGLIVVDGDRALMVDSPMSEVQTVELAWWLDKNLGARIESFVPGHWHDDCVGGMPWLNRNGVKTYACEQTNRILASQGTERARESFADSLILPVGDTRVEVYFLGGGHATDNVVAWVPSDKVLFGGCMFKDTTAGSIGNTSDAAPLDEWLRTVERVENKFPEMLLLVPGHGPVGGKEIFAHTKKIVAGELRRSAQPE